MESTPILFLEFSLIGFIAVLWWLAKRDLTAQATNRRLQSGEEIRKMQETIEGLISVLEERADEIVTRVDLLYSELRQIEEQIDSRRDFILRHSQSVTHDNDTLSATRQPVVPIYSAGNVQQSAENVSSQVSSQSVEESEPTIENALEMLRTGKSIEEVSSETGYAVSELELAQRVRQARHRSLLTKKIED